VSHPHIVTFYSAQPIDGRMVMTTECLGFEPLSARLRGGAMPWREAIGAACQLLSALACLHEANVVHLDITPDSIVFQNGTWKLANFEKARVVNGVPLNGNGAVSGNVKYISPEQVKGTALDAGATSTRWSHAVRNGLRARPLSIRPASSN
jgi:serine/threonine-protein kinase